MTEPAATTAPEPAVERARFTEPARQVPTKWLTYEVRYIASIAIIAFGFIIAAAVALATSPTTNGSLVEAAERTLRLTALWAPIIGAILSAVIAPGRGERRVFYGAAAAGAAFAFDIMVLMQAPTKLVTLILLAVAAGFMVWAWMLLRDRRAILQLLAVAAVLLTLGFGGTLTELINGSGTLAVGWPIFFALGQHVATASAIDLARESVVIWFTQCAVAIASIVGIAWVARALATRMRAITPQERDAVSAAKLAVERARAAERHEAYLAANPGALAEPRTNTMALLALIFGVLGGWLAIVFGFIALSQIKRTGERGRGMAITGIVISFVLTIPVLLFFILGFSGVFNR